MVSGTVHIYVESGVEGYTKEYGDIAVASVQEGADYVYIITLAEELENSKSYKIIFDGTEQIIRMSFSMAKDGPWRPM